MVTRRGYLASLAGGTATTTGTATSVITTITSAVFPSREPNARHNDWYGTRTTNRDAYVVDYEYVPVTTRADVEWEG